MYLCFHCTALVLETAINHLLIMKKVKQMKTHHIEALQKYTESCQT